MELKLRIYINRKIFEALFLFATQVLQTLKFQC